MWFAWDPKKAEINRRKHGVTFDEAATVFQDPLSATVVDVNAGVTEERLITIGRSSLGRLVLVIHTEVGETIRIISARVATTRERKRHEN